MPHLHAEGNNDCASYRRVRYESSDGLLFFAQNVDLAKFLDEVIEELFGVILKAQGQIEVDFLKRSLNAFHVFG